MVACFGSGHPGVSVRPLYREEVVLAIDPALLESATGLNVEQAVSTLETEGLAILADCPFLLERIDDISGRVARNELQSAGIKPIGFVESENMMTLLSLCAAGLGGLFCPTNMLDETTDLTKNLVRVKLSGGGGYQISIGTRKAPSPGFPPRCSKISSAPFTANPRHGCIARKSAAVRGPAMRHEHQPRRSRRTARFTRIPGQGSRLASLALSCTNHETRSPRRHHGKLPCRPIGRTDRRHQRKSRGRRAS